MLHTGRARDGDDVLPLVQQPGQRQLRGGAAHFGRDGTVACQQLQVGCIRLGRKARHATADVLGVQRAHIGEVATQKAPPHRAEGHKRHAQFTAGVEHRNLGVARPQRILGLQGCNGVHGMGAAQRGGRHFRQANAADLARAHQVGQRAHAVFNGHALVPAVQVVQVNHIRLQAAQAVFAGLAQRGGAPVNHAHQLAVAIHIHALHAAFAGQGEAVAVWLHHPAHQGFVGAKAVQRSGVEQGHARIQRGQQHTLALLSADRGAIGVREVHAAQANGADLERAQSTLLHHFSDI